MDKLSLRLLSISPAPIVPHKSGVVSPWGPRIAPQRSQPPLLGTSQANRNRHHPRPRAPRSTRRRSSQACAWSSAIRAVLSRPSVLLSLPARSSPPATVQSCPSIPPATSAPSPRSDVRHRSTDSLPRSFLLWTFSSRPQLLLTV